MVYFLKPKFLNLGFLLINIFHVLFFILKKVVCLLSINNRK